ncbi:hypothetical protein ACQKPX_21140 [Photobacterium sp. DNB23_23_1]|uniref:DUF4381 domain-containing protein n=1 Tax=Photobacterium pectinilyticum TaxID=2906793 RepID=A0ABT1MY78_9GAMM|nr:hypothetical protein [Photobacterium sp. ZSDE20]MCQ1056624.1 hypothetical protein [Photobacterium sp. ZSDE20]MDD1820759.1 hypothetical protein [Photobacterium sp. ZSDE20]
MSDVPVSVTTAAEVIQPVAESSGSIWGYVAGGVALLILAGFFGYKMINKPAFIINRVRKRNLKEIKKLGVENSDFVNDLDKLLDSVENYATKNGMKGTDVVKIISPMNDSARIKTAGDMYQSMIYIANDIKDTSLAREFKTKSKQVKANSPLMAGLFKRAGI